MSNRVLLKKSSVAGKIPAPSDLSYGEVALNYADGKLYFKDSSNLVKTFSASPQLSINDLTDVDTQSTAPIVGDVLKWDGSKWAPGTDATVGGTGTDADTLDGFDSSYYLNYNNLNNRPTLFSGDYNDLTNSPALFSGDYNDLTNKPSVPTLTSQLTNDSGYLTSYTETDPIYTASSWYTTANNSSNWDLAYGWGDHSLAGYLLSTSSIDWNQISNTPTLFSGNYNDLTDKPVIVNTAVQWTPYHTLADGTRYLAGDVVYDGGNLFVANYDNESLPTTNTEYWTNLGPGNRLNMDGRDIPNITYAQLTGKPTIPSNTSDLTNDAGFATETYVNTQIATLVDSSPDALNTLNELAAALGDDPNFATTIATQIGQKANSADLATVAATGSYNDLTNKPTLFSGDYADLLNKPSLFSGAYNDLTGKPTLFSGSYTDLTNKPTLFSGSYTDLTNKPTLFSGNYSDLVGKPTLSTVATSGSYTDLTNKPSLFSGSYTDLTNKPNLFSGSYLDLADRPSLFSGNYNDLINRPALFSGSYLDLTNRPSLFSGSYNDLTNKPSFKTINGQSIVGSGNIEISGGTGGGASTLNDLTDVDTVTNAPANGQSLVYNASQQKWIPQTITGGGSSLQEYSAVVDLESTPTAIDSIPIADFTCARYNVVMVNDLGKYETTEFVVIHNDSQITFQQYNQFVLNQSTGSLAAEIDGSNAVIKFTGNSTTTNIKFTRTIISKVTVPGGSTFAWPTDLESESYGDIDLQTDNYPDKDLN